VKYKKSVQASQLVVKNLNRSSACMSKLSIMLFFSPQSKFQHIWHEWMWRTLRLVTHNCYKQENCTCELNFVKGEGILTLRFQPIRTNYTNPNIHLNMMLSFCCSCHCDWNIHDNSENVQIWKPYHSWTQASYN
jgi:hypothetical protein